MTYSTTLVMLLSLFVSGTEVRRMLDFPHFLFLILDFKSCDLRDQNGTKQKYERNLTYRKRFLWFLVFPLLLSLPVKS